MSRDDSNRNGAHFEGAIKDALIRSGYYFLNAKERQALLKSDGEITPDEEKWFTDQVYLDRNIYGAKFSVDFFLYHSVKWPQGLYIECKYQGSAGSVDEKYVFTVMSLKQLRAPSVLVMAGTGARAGARQWIKQQQKKGRFMYFDYDGFFEFVRTAL